MSTISLIFPHQLLEKSPLPLEGSAIYMVEEWLFFKQYPFHKQKLVFHRATMQFYKDYLEKTYKKEVIYIESTSPISDIQKLVEHLSSKKIETIHYIDTVDNWLEKHLQKSTRIQGISLVQYPSPLFLNTQEQLGSFFRPDKKKLFHADFYKSERKSKGILLEADQSPTGGKWSFDVENRKRFPKNTTPPPISNIPNNSYLSEAIDYIHKSFPKSIGNIEGPISYPTDFPSARSWFQMFLSQRFYDFGKYEDAIVYGEHVLHHSLLSPLINVGLLTPHYILQETLRFSKKKEIPLASLEGFIRQIIGWREFIRGVYVSHGSRQRTANYWRWTQRMPKSFYTGKTGVLPVDYTIQKILKTGYCHHIERLMVLGNFMLLCEIHPDDIYQWFMEFFIDSYDWVMVPNVYGMSQFADGGFMTTKPYISGSNYLKKMGNYPKGEWEAIWDALFWRFLAKHKDFFLKQPRLSMLIRQWDKREETERHQLLKTANTFLKRLFS
jgi:deoxyribodipyrimidine photolyase-related protein